MADRRSTARDSGAKRRTSSVEQKSMLDVGEGFPPMPVEKWVNADKGCAPARRALVTLRLPERVWDATRKVYEWRYTVQFSFSGRDHAAAMRAANKFMLAELRRQARRTQAKEKRATGRKKQAARERAQSDGEGD